MRRLTIEEVESRWPDMIKGQKWSGTRDKYWFVCKTHGKYLQIYNNHQRGFGCDACGGTILKDLNGKKFGKWTVVSRANNNKHGHTMWHCVCRCGIEKDVDRQYLLSGESTSCGCKNVLRPYESLYNAFNTQARRRGIEVTLTYGQFLEFVTKDSCFYCGAKLKWSEHTIKNSQAFNMDRKDNNKGYTSENVVQCCWPCNNIKSSRFTFSQFKEIGNLLREWNFPGSVILPPAYLNCPYCPSITYMSSKQPNLIFTLYECNCHHKFFIKKHQPQTEPEKENNNDASNV